VEVERGQSAVIDASLIAPILMLILLMGLVISSSNTNVFMLEKNENRYAEDLTYSFLKSTVRYVQYTDSSGNQIILEDKSVEQLISEDLYLRVTGGAEISTVKAGIEDKMNETLKSLTHPEYEYSFHASYHGASFVIGSGTLPDNKMSYTTYIDMPQNGDKVTITMYVWRVR